MLTDDLELPSLNQIDEKGLSGTYFKNIKLPNCTTVKDYAFEGSQAEEIILNNASTVGNYAFNNCKNLKTVYTPKAVSLGNSFSGCTNLDLIFAPNATGLILSIPNNAIIYCSDKLRGVDFFDEYKTYKYTFVSPDYTPGLNEADRGGYTDRFIRVNSDIVAESKGGQIRTRDNGLRFGFKLDESKIGFDFRKYADNVDYGFVYTFDEVKGNDFQINNNVRANKTTTFVKSADKRDVDGTVSTYNAVFTGIPSSYYDHKITTRAYICVDGMYFYSPVIQRSFSDVASSIIADDTVDDNIRKEVSALMNKEVQ